MIRPRVWSLRFKCLNQMTTAPSSGSKSKSSLLQNSGSMTATAMTVLPAPVVADSDNGGQGALERGSS